MFYFCLKVAHHILERKVKIWSSYSFRGTGCQNQTTWMMLCKFDTDAFKNISLSKEPMIKFS